MAAKHITPEEAKAKATSEYVLKNAEEIHFGLISICYRILEEKLPITERFDGLTISVGVSLIEALQEKNAELQAREQKLREALGKYRDPNNWMSTLYGEYHGEGRCSKDQWNVGGEEGYELAQRALKEVYGD